MQLAATPTTGAVASLAPVELELVSRVRQGGPGSVRSVANRATHCLICDNFFMTMERTPLALALIQSADNKGVAEVKRISEL